MITINRNNYEAFFLLYVDEELQPAERREVELFIESNPDLAQELNMLKETKLQPELNLRFADKSSLTRTGVADINTDNYEEYFLLFLDNELGKIERNAVEKFILQHPHLQEQFTQLQQTILPIENLLFVDKKVLFRSQKEDWRIAIFSVQRMAVAAAIIGIALVAWWLTSDSNKQLPTQSLAITTTTSIKDKPSEEAHQVEVVHHTLIGSNTDAIAVGKNKNNASDGVFNQAVNTEPNQQNIATTSQEQLTTHSEKKPDEISLNNEKNIAITAAISPKVLMPLEEIPEENTKFTNAEFTGTNATVKTAVYRELDTEEDTKGVYLGSFEINKNKLKGLFKKASRILGIKSKEIFTNDEETLASNDDINTKKIR